MTTNEHPTAAERAEAEAWGDRVLKLIDVAQEAVARGDVPTALMALRESIESSPRRRRKAITGEPYVDRADRDHKP